MGYRWNPVSRDYLARQRRIRQISTIVMTVIFSIVVAAIIIYSSNPGSTAH
jgi:ABC-type lipoprotein release transport system permease subunit